MVDVFLLGGKIAFAVVGLGIGFRLAREARSSDGLGTHSLGSAVIFIGGVGLATTSVGPAFAEVSHALAVALSLGGDALERLALVGLCVFVAKVFRPDAAWPLPLTVCLGLALAASWAWEASVQPWPGYDAALESGWSTQVTFALPFAWSALEAGGEWRRGKRKAVLGLAREIDVARFGLWTLGCSGFVGICLIALVIPAVLEAGRVQLASGLIVVRAGLYYIVAAALWVGVFEPAFYARRFAPADA